MLQRALHIILFIFVVQGTRLLNINGAVRITSKHPLCSRSSRIMRVVDPRNIDAHESCITYGYSLNFKVAAFRYLTRTAITTTLWNGYVFKCDHYTNPLLLNTSPLLNCFKYVLHSCDFSVAPKYRNTTHLTITISTQIALYN